MENASLIELFKLPLTSISLTTEPVQGPSICTPEAFTAVDSTGNVQNVLGNLDND